MSATPFAARAVHFEDISFASFGSPSSVAAPTSIDYLNAQLVAHGFAHGSGLNLSDLRGRDQQDVLKCLANMLGQRLDDMSRAEQLSAKYKTLSYDHERLVEQNRLSKESAAQAQREMETTKAKAESIQKKLIAEEEAHRKAREDHQKVKMAMAYLRTTTANDIKRKEMEMEKMAEKVAKIANEQAKLGAIGSGLACANLLPEQQPTEEGSSIWEQALTDSETARLRLLKENDALKDVILGCANALVHLHHSTVSSTTKAHLDEPELILSDVLFASDRTSTGPETAHQRLRALFAELKDAIEKASSKGNSRRKSLQQREEDARRIQQLQRENEELQAQLQEVQAAARQQGQQLLEQFVSDARFMAGQRNLADMSMDFMGTPDKHAVALQLDEQRKHLESERDKFTEATIKLGQEKAALEAERLRFLEEKRNIMLQSMLDELPPTPEAPERTQHDTGLSRLKGAMDGVSALKQVGNEAVMASVASTEPEIPLQTSQPIASKPTTSTVQINSIPSFNSEQGTLAASTTPPLSDNELSPTPTTEGVSSKRPPAATLPSVAARTLATAPVSQGPPSIPPSFRAQTTPVRPIHPPSRVQHKYSPAVPSPLSKVVRITESPPSSPESRAQKAVNRVSVIAEEDEEEVITPPEAERIAEEVQEAEEEVEDLAVNLGGRQGSLSPLSRIMNMGLSPAIAPTLAIPSFPGLLGTGSLAQDLLGKPKETELFGKIPGGFQLGTALQSQPLLPNPAKGTAKVAKTIRTTMTAGGTTGARVQAKGRQEVKPKAKGQVVLGENRPSSKESTTSSSDAGSSSEGRSSSRASSSKKSATGLGTGKPIAAKGRIKEKENDTKRKPIVASKQGPVKKPAPTKPVAKPSVRAAIKKSVAAASTRPGASKVSAKG